MSQPNGNAPTVYPRTPSEKTAAVPFTAATPLHILLAEDDELSASR